MPEKSKAPQWHHAPIHILSQRGIYMVTSGTYQRHPFFSGSSRLTLLRDSLLSCTAEFCWDLRAWAVFSNHYHFIASSPEHPSSLSRVLSKLHMCTAKAVNLEENCKGRKVWNQYWDVRIDFEKSYFARLNYVMCNPVKHGLVSRPTDYPWCSAGWFEANAESSFCRAVTMFRTDALKIDDDF